MTLDFSSIKTQILREIQSYPESGISLSMRISNFAEMVPEEYAYSDIPRAIAVSFILNNCNCFKKDESFASEEF